MMKGGRRKGGRVGVRDGEDSESPEGPSHPDVKETRDAYHRHSGV
jgi:hypothetical protein